MLDTKALYTSSKLPFETLRHTPAFLTTLALNLCHTALLVRFVRCFRGCLLMLVKLVTKLARTITKLVTASIVVATDPTRLAVCLPKLVTTLTMLVRTITLVAMSTLRFVRHTALHVTSITRFAGCHAKNMTRCSRDVCHTALAAVVPSIAQWHLASLAEVITSLPARPSRNATTITSRPRHTSAALRSFAWKEAHVSPFVRCHTFLLRSVGFVRL